MSTFDPTCMIGFKDGNPVESTPEQIQALIDAMSNPKVAVHIHGGLVTADSAMDNATKLKPAYVGAGALPIFPIWHTGLVETVEAHWTTIALSVFARLFRQKIASAIQDLLPHAAFQAQTFAPAEADSSSILLPVHWKGVQQATDNYLLKNPDPVLFAEFQKLVRERGPEPLALAMPKLVGASPESTLLRAEFISKAQSPKTNLQPAITAHFDLLGPLGHFMSAVGDVIKAVAQRFLNHSDHGLQATIWEEVLRAVYVDTIGQDVWTAMTTGAKLACAQGTPLFNFFSGIKDKTDKLVLIGHSAGAIMICELLDMLFDQLQWRGEVSVLFLAPAVRMERFEKALKAHGDKIHFFRMFTMEDRLERQDVLTEGILSPALADAFYPSSLLYFISGLLDGTDDFPLVGMDRYYRAGAAGDPAKSQTVLNFVLDPNAPPKVCWSVSTSTDPTMNANSVHHGGFGCLSDGGKINTTMTSVLNLVNTL